MQARPDFALISVPSVGTRQPGQAGSTGGAPAPTWRPSTPERCPVGASGLSLWPGSWWSLTRCWWEQFIMRTRSHSNNGFSAQITCSLKTKKRLRSRKCEKNAITMEISRPGLYNNDDYNNLDYDYWRSILFFILIKKSIYLYLLNSPILPYMQVFDLQYIIHKLQSRNLQFFNN